MDAGALEIVQVLVRAGFIAYFAGGCVRDHLMGIPPHDIDIATDASVDEVSALFARSIQVGSAFGVVQVILDGRGYEVASFRKESGYSDGRHPDHVERASPEEDAARRDFTINGMFYDPMTNKVIDYVGGESDLNKRLLRAIGDPIERMEEDRLRALRAIRFACRFDLKMDPQTLKAVEAVAKKIPSSVSIERIREELGKMASHLSFSKALFSLQETGILEAIFPEFRKGNLDRESIDLLGPDIPLELKLIGLFMHLPKEGREALFERLKCSRLARSRIDAFSAFEQMDFESAPPHEKARLLAHPERDLILKALFAHMGQAKGSLQEIVENDLRELDFHIEALRKKKAILRASDLTAEGISPGPLLGELLETAQNDAIDSDIRDKAALLERLKKGPLWPLNDN